MGTSASLPDRVAIEFGRFDLANYELFLRAKKLPESELAYDWEGDRYTLTTPRRFAALLGIVEAAGERSALPLASYLFDYEHFIVGQALASKRYAIFADCGLGKTAMFLEFARQVMHATGGKVLILSPLQIIEQTREEALLGPTPLRGLPQWTPWPYAQDIVRLDTRAELVAWLKDTPSKQSDVRTESLRDGSAVGSGLRTDGGCDGEPSGRFASPIPVAICNYEKLIDGQIPELRNLAGLICDESSILKSGGGVIKWNLIKSARGIEYKLSCTATPAPNDIMEYASQAAFLEKLRTEGEILWTFFSRDKKGNWRIKPHAEAGFYRFLASWSIYLRDPAHYSWADNLSNIPAPEFRDYELPMTDAQRKESQRLFHSTGAGLFGDKRLGVRERSKLSQLAKGFLYGIRPRSGNDEKQTADVDKSVSGSDGPGQLSEPPNVRRIHSIKPSFIAGLIESEVSGGGFIEIR